MKKKVVFFPPNFFLDYKNVALVVLRAVGPLMDRNLVVWSGQ